MSIIKRDIPGKNLIKFILKFSPLKNIGQSFVFTYKGQKPNVALYIKNGQINVGAEKILVSHKDKGRLLFFEELLDGIIINENVEVAGGSLVSIIDKRTAKEIVDFTCLQAKKIEKS